MFRTSRHFGKLPPLGFGPGRHDRLNRRLGVAARARRAAERNEPSPAAAGPDENEVHIVEGHRARLGKLNAAYGEVLTDERAEQDRLAAQFGTERVRDSAAAAAQALATTKRMSWDPLVQARRRERQDLRELTAFKHANELGRDAHYPASRALLYAVVSLMAVVEAGANAWLFATVSDYGLVGGSLQASIVAAVNVVLAYNVGVLVRGVNATGMRRGIMVGAAVLLVGLLLVYHGAVGHYRQALVDQPEVAMRAALVTLEQHPFATPDLQTWLLVLVGLVAAAGAGIAGYHADDPFPGFGGVDRRYREAAADYEALKEAYLADVHRICEVQVTAVEGLYREAQEAFQGFRESIGRAKEWARAYLAQAAGLCAACVQAIQTYRAIIEGIRTSRSPGYFSTSPRPFEARDFLDLAQFDLDAQGEVVAGFEKQRHALGEASQQVKAEIRGLCVAHLDEAPAYFEAVERSVDGDGTPPSALVPVDLAKRGAEKS